MTDQSSNVVVLNDRRRPVQYSVAFTHHHDGSIEFTVHDIADDRDSRIAIADTLNRAAAILLAHIT